MPFCRVSPSLAFLRAAQRVNPAPAHSRASWSANRSLDRADQHQNGADAPDRSCDHGRRGARLILSVIRTKNEDIGSVGIGVLSSGAVFIVAPRFFDDARGLGTAGPNRTFRSQARQQRKNTSTSGCYDRRGCLGKSPHPSGRLATVGQRRAAGTAIAASGHDSRAGVQSTIAPAFARSTGRLRHRARRDRRAGSHHDRGARCVATAPLCGLFDTSGRARAFGRSTARFRGRITPGYT